MTVAPQPLKPHLIVAWIVVVAAVAVTVVCVTKALSQPDDVPSVWLYAPTSLGVLLLIWTSAYTWRRAARRPQALVVRRRAFQLWPDRAVTRVVAFVLASAFPLGNWIIRARESLGLAGWISVVLTVIVVPLAFLHVVFLLLGSPRPLVRLTAEGLSAHGFLGSVRAPWNSFRSDYAAWPDRRMRLDLPVFERSALRRRGLKPHGVRLPSHSHEGFGIPAAWRTNPWWAALAISTYWHSPANRRAIGTDDEYRRLANQVGSYRHEIDEQLRRYR